MAAQGPFCANGPVPGQEPLDDEAEMRPRAPHASESAIQSSILAYLGALGLPAWRMNSRVMRVPGRDGRPRLLRFGGQRGMADIVAIGPGGRFVAIEVKSARGTVNPWQAALLLAVEKAGGVAIVARSAADVARAMSRAFPGFVAMGA